MQNYRDLVVWNKAMDLVADVYRVTREWPPDELYGLTSQARRASASIPTNVAEGQGRTGAKEYLHHLSIAYGSLRELETELLIALRLEYIDKVRCDALMGQAAEVGRLLLGLMRSLRSQAAGR